MANPWTRDQLDKQLPPFEMANQKKQIIKMLKALKQKDEIQKLDVDDLKSRVQALEAANPEAGN